MIVSTYFVGGRLRRLLNINLFITSARPLKSLFSLFWLYIWDHYVYIYNIGLLTVNIEFIWQGWETGWKTSFYIFTWLLLQAYLSMTHTVCKHVKTIHTYMYRRFEHVLSKLGRVEKTERLIFYLNKLNWFTEMYLTTMSNTQMLSYWDI
jgi:hypothetical protein